MTEIINERLSAFVDSELPESDAKELYRDLMADSELRAAWERYHVIGDSLRNELACRPGALGTSVQDQLAAEPSILAPRRLERSWVRPLAGLAIAASVASVAILGWYQTRPQDSDAGAPLAVRDAPVPGMKFVSSEEKLLSTPRLNSYLMNHHERTSNIGMQGVMPYVQLVGYDPAAE
jgi:sigma-E factor negative regulatory protein RseA